MPETEKSVSSSPGQAVASTISSATRLEIEDSLKQDIFRRTIALASAAHELKTPLSVMTGYTDLLLGQLLGPLNEQQRKVQRIGIRQDPNCKRAGGRKRMHR
ncbi:MAG: hypothetical protein DMG64_01090 [Acidobacteria bacterium]|nr:MAG: hypothetical protein DMG64_01090 [Acidobacteriota bacterium]